MKQSNYRKPNRPGNVPRRNRRTFTSTFPEEPSRPFPYLSQYRAGYLRGGIVLPGGRNRGLSGRQLTTPLARPSYLDTNPRNQLNHIMIKHPGSGIAVINNLLLVTLGMLLGLIVAKLLL